jgi:NAD(P)-dependent dehydrogenase (short-subunit alcohol dehydrogenase family)
MTIADTTILVTGANRGIGRALVEEALRRGAKRVYAVLTGPTDTEMPRDFDIPKASPESVARAIFDAVDNGEEDIFPDPMSRSVADSWRGGAAKALERQNAALAA